MTRSTPTIKNAVLLLHAEEQAISIVVGSTQWFEWLNEETSRIFSFHAADGTYTARKERAGNLRGGWYWKAYRKAGGTQYRAYLGKSEDLTLAHLNQIARTLAERVREQAKVAQDVSEEGPDRHSAPSHRQSHANPSVTPLLESKLHPPRLPALLVERSQLLALLDAGQKQKLTLVHAPAGFGKTTLVTQWIAQRKKQDTASQHTPMSVAWLSLDSGDNDPVRFWSSIITACQSIHTHIGQTALAHLAQDARSLFSSASLETALTFLLNDLERSGSQGVLVLEDYHLIEHKRIHETMTFFIEHLPAGLHVVVLTRSEPPLPLVRWRARGDLLEIASRQLSFSAEESATFLQQVMPQAFSQEAARWLYAHLEGWPAGMRLLTASLQGHWTPQALSEALSEFNVDRTTDQMPRALQEFFLEEIFNAQPEPLQLFLLQTSLLRRLTGSLCDTLTGRNDSGEWLQMIEGSGIFLEALDNTGRWYRYHALWAATMRAEAARRLGQMALRDLSTLASRWYEEHGLPVEAIEAALIAQDFERAALLIVELNAQTYFPEYHTMQRWIERLPEPLLRAQPTLCFLLAQARLFSEENAGPIWRIEPVENLLQVAEEGWRKQGNLFQIGILYAFRATFTLLHGHTVQAAGYAHQALQLLPPPDARRPYDKQPGEWIEWHCGCLMTLGMDASQAGSFAQAYPFLLEAYTLSLHKQDRVFTRVMGWQLGDVCSEMGQLHQATSFYQQTLNEPAVEDDELGENILRANSLAGLMRLAYERNEIEKVEQLLREASRYKYRDDFSFGEEYVRAKIELLRILLLFACGERASAQAALSTLFVRQQANANSLHLAPEVLIWQARLQIRAADLEGAENTLNALATYAQDLLPLQQEAQQLLHVRLSLAHGEDETALPLLTQLLAGAQARKHVTRVIEIHLLIALAHFANKQRSEARQQISQALAQARNEGFLRIFLDEGEPLAVLLRALLPTLTETSQRASVQSILQTFNNLDPESKAEQPLLEPLSAQEQRVLTLLVAGRSNSEIAETLIISINTVKGHVKNLYRKLDVTNRMEANEVARRLKLI
ncbi:MAG TPA: LuxR C-terminal-related transcriptional regulator [Ktedonosporobacter sp.]|nr:LuxR C-terminal-related transcriptional regulator [Ktedonosporobacter sp.]